MMPLKEKFLRSSLLLSINFGISALATPLGKYVRESQVLSEVKAKHFKSQSCKKFRDISLDDFLKYFENMSTDMFNSSNEESEAFNVYNDFNLPNDVYPELDRQISIDEIMDAVKFLKSSK